MHVASTLLLFPTLFPMTAIFKIMPVNAGSSLINNGFQHTQCNDSIVIVLHLNDQEMFFFILGRDSGPFAIEQFRGLIWFIYSLDTARYSGGQHSTAITARPPLEVFVLVLHVPSDFLHGLKHLVERHKMLAITH